MRRSLRAAIEARAFGRCEYCQAPAEICGYRFHLEHVVPVALGGSDGHENRALACASCNLAKAARVSAVDPLTGETASLFDPRSATWHDHFRWDDQRLLVVGLTASGRATVDALDMNSDFRREARAFWFELGLLPQPSPA